MASVTPRSSSRYDIILHLNTVDELFTVDPLSIYADTGRLIPGIEEIRQELLARKRFEAGQRVILMLPRSEFRPGTEDLIHRAVIRYCRLHIAEGGRNLRLIWRQGMQSLRTGSLLFLVGLGLSYYFTRSYIPEIAQQLLGNGVFLVILWIGLWYPLDLLFFARQPVRREVRMLSILQQIPFVIIAEDTPESSPAPNSTRAAPDRGAGPER
jgi:hypothetical protein